jgi:hypothetical protein
LGHDHSIHFKNGDVDEDSIRAGSTPTAQSISFRKDISRAVSVKLPLTSRHGQSRNITGQKHGDKSQGLEDGGWRMEDGANRGVARCVRNRQCSVHESLRRLHEMRTRCLILTLWNEIRSGERNDRRVEIQQQGHFEDRRFHHCAIIRNHGAFSFILIENCGLSIFSMSGD